MGGFFARYFLSRGIRVVGSDPRRGRLRGVTRAGSDASAVNGADVVLVATPMGTIVEVCRSVIPKMKEGSLLVEISSVKGDAPARLGRAAEKEGVHFLSVHPLFGPTLKSYAGMRMAVVRDGNDRSMRYARRIFPTARLFPMTAQVHDNLMSVMLSLTHLVGMAYAQVVSDTIDPRAFKKMATPSSRLQVALAEGVLSQNPRLYSGIEFSNSFTTDAVRRMALELLKINVLLEKGDERGFRTNFRRLARAFSVDASSMARVYRAFDALSG